MPLPWPLDAAGAAAARPRGLVDALSLLCLPRSSKGKRACRTCVCRGVRKVKGRAREGGGGAREARERVCGEERTTRAAPEAASGQSEQHQNDVGNDNDDDGDQQQPSKAPAPKGRFICIPIRLTYTTHASAPRMQSNSERMAGCAVYVSTEGKGGG